MDLPKKTVIRGNHASREFLNSLFHMKQHGVLGKNINIFASILVRQSL